MLWLSAGTLDQWGLGEEEGMEGWREGGMEEGGRGGEGGRRVGEGERGVRKEWSEEEGRRDGRTKGGSEGETEEGKRKRRQERTK